MRTALACNNARSASVRSRKIVYNTYIYNEGNLKRKRTAGSILWYNLEARGPSAKKKRLALSLHPAINLSARELLNLISGVSPDDGK